MILVTEKAHANHCAISGKRDAGHANSIAESCGTLSGDGSRCDSNPHSRELPHHCCGDTWQKHWTES